MDDVSMAEKEPLLNTNVEINDLATFRFPAVPTPDIKKDEAGSTDKEVDNCETKDLGTNLDDEEKEPADKKGDEKQEDVRIRTKDIGIWRVFYQDKPWSYIPGIEIIRQFREIMETLPYVWRFTKEIWTLAPGYLLLWVFLRVWESIDSALSLWVTAKLLDTVGAFFNFLLSVLTRL